MILGELIDSLAGLDSSKPPVLSDGNMPLKLESWRGVYAQLSIDYCDPSAPQPAWRDTSPMTVGRLLEQARAADGGTFEGYKGGQHTMSRETAVWISRHGDYEHKIPVGFVEREGTVVMTVTEIPGEYR